MNRPDYCLRLIRSSREKQMVAAHFSTQLGRCRPRTANGGRQFFSSYYAARIRRPFFNTPRPDPAARARSSSGPAVSFQRHVHVMIKVPSMADSISEGTLSTFSKQIGEYIEADEELASIETDKIDVSVNAPHAGVVTKLLVTIGETVTVDQEIAQIDTEAESSSPPSEPPSERDEVRKEVHSEPDTDNPPGSITARSEDSMGTPAREESADNHDSHVSAPPSRPIDPSKEEFGTRQGVREIKSPPLAVPVIEDVQTPAHNVPLRSERLEPLPRMRKTIAQRLKMSQSTNASLTTMQEIDMSKLMDWRRQNKDRVLEAHGVRLGYMGAFVRAATLAAQQFPSINGAIDVEKEQLIFRDYVDISIAVSTPKGLVTPVLRNCECLSVLEIEKQVLVLANKARIGKLTMADLDGGNFSISNPGIFGSMFGTPVINYRQSAVFNMNTIYDRVVAVDGKPAIRPIMYTTLSYDLRLVEEREAVSFLNNVRDYIEEPSRMLLV